MGILSWLFGSKEGNSAKKAKERLMMVLEYERKKLPPNFPELLKQDLVQVFSKYNQFDVDHIEVEIRRENNATFEELWISIPFKS